MTGEEYDSDGDGIINWGHYWTYDANGNMTGEEYDSDGDGIDLGYYYTYDANGNMTREEYDSDGDGVIDEVVYYTWEVL
jgi:hypothetical protein